MNQPPSKVRLSVIILNYNSNEWLEKCLRSFTHLVQWREDQPECIETIVVDGASTAPPEAEFKKNFPWVNWIDLTENKGYSAGNNIGIKAAQGEFIMLLNPDTEFTEHTDLFSLLDTFADAQVGIVTPKVILDSGELDRACHRGFPTPWNSLMYFSGIAKLLPWLPAVAGYQRSWQDLSKRHEIEACSGAAMIVRSSLLPKIGLLDENYFMYAEDIDWCYRFAQQGYKTLYDPQVTVIHHKYKSGKQANNWETKARTISAFYDTMGQFMQKHYSQRYPTILLWLASAMINWLKRWQLTKERKKYDRAVSSK